MQNQVVGPVKRAVKIMVFCIGLRAARSNFYDREFDWIEYGFIECRFGHRIVRDIGLWYRHRFDNHFGL